MQANSDLKRQYQGFLDTPILWKEGEVMGMKQFLPSRTKSNPIDQEVSERLRLGNLVEHFTFHELSQNIDIKILATNLQILTNKVTKGEIDCLLKYKKDYVHLEIVYKFYLYDDSVDGSELHKWVGPNKKDTLIQKLSKLKNKQLPLLFENQSEKTLELLGLKPSQFRQMLNFKAQLFLPLNFSERDMSFINQECVKGFYVKKAKLKSFAKHRFHLPSKRNWLCEPHSDVEWMSYGSFESEIEILLNQKRSPLCWLRSEDGKLERFFTVWW